MATRRTERERSIAALGEDHVARELQARGLVPVMRNVRIDGVEVDLIVRRGRDYAIVEVKTSLRGTAPETRVGSEQRRRLQRARSGLRSTLGSECVSVELLVAAVTLLPELRVRFFRLEE